MIGSKNVKNDYKKKFKIENNKPDICLKIKKPTNWFENQ